MHYFSNKPEINLLTLVVLVVFCAVMISLSFPKPQDVVFESNSSAIYGNVNFSNLNGRSARTAVSDGNAIQFPTIAMPSNFSSSTRAKASAKSYSSKAATPSTVTVQSGISVNTFSRSNSEGASVVNSGGGSYASGSISSRNSSSNQGSQAVAPSSMSFSSFPTKKKSFFAANEITSIGGTNDLLIDKEVSAFDDFSSDRPSRVDGDGDNGQPGVAPVGDGVWIVLGFALLYVVFKFFSKRSKLFVVVDTKTF